MLKAALLSLRLLEPRDRKLFGIAVCVQSMVGLLDLVGVMLLTAAIGLALEYSSGSPTLAVASPLVQWSTDRGWSFETLLAFVGIVAASFLVAKSGLALLINRRVLWFLASRQRLISARLARGLLGLPMQVLQTQPSQRWVYAATDGVNVATSSLLGGGVALVGETVTIVSLFLFLLSANPAIALASVLLFGGISIIFYVRLSARAHQAGDEAGRSSIKARAYLQEAVESCRELKVYRRVDWPANEAGQLWGRTSWAMARSSYLVQLPRYLLEVVLVVSVASVTLWSFGVLESEAAVETVVLFLVTAGRIIPSLMRMQQALITVRAASGEAAPTYALALAIESKDPHIGAATPSATRMQRLPTGTISAKHLTFKYEGAEAPTLEGIDLEIASGSFTAIVGPSGGGKSTLADVILGLLDATSGSLLISGMSPNELMDRHPGHVSYVPQFPVLINGSIRSNVALAVPDSIIDDQRIWESLEMAGLSDLMAELPSGLDTWVLEHGQRLSGGQRQRLGIARALYGSPAILVLDEATSALDAATEAGISSVMASLSGSVTRVMIAHRLSTVMNADQVIYLDRGRVLASGSFAEVRTALPEFDRQARLSGM